MPRQWVPIAMLVVSDSAPEAYARAFDLVRELNLHGPALDVRFVIGHESEVRQYDQRDTNEVLPRDVDPPGTVPASKGVRVGEEG